MGTGMDIDAKRMGIDTEAGFNKLPRNVCSKLIVGSPLWGQDLAKG